jgi:hypothetical protein
MLLDDWLPDYRISERHARTVEAAPEQAFAAFLALPVGCDRLVRALFRLRGLGDGAGTSVAEFSQRPPFVRLAAEGLELVFGSRHGSDGRARTAEQWRALEEPGLKIAANIRAIPLAGGRTRLTTETRVVPLGRRWTIRFRLYWLVVRPFSGLIRRRWLRAAAARATASARA